MTTTAASLPSFVHKTTSAICAARSSPKNEFGFADFSNATAGPTSFFESKEELEILANFKSGDIFRYEFAICNPIFFLLVGFDNRKNGRGRPRFLRLATVLCPSGATLKLLKPNPSTTKPSDCELPRSFVCHPTHSGTVGRCAFELPVRNWTQRPILHLDHRLQLPADQDPYEFAHPLVVSSKPRL